MKPKLKIITILLILMTVLTACQTSNKDFKNNKDLVYKEDNLNVIQNGELDPKKVLIHKSEIEDKNNKNNKGETARITLPANLISSDGQAVENFVISNPNENTINMKYKMVNSETKELLYESPILKPNQKIEGITINNDLEKNKYKVQIHVEFIKDNETEKTNLTYGVETTLTVLN